ncbi:MAG: lipocalin family protein [Bacteroidales bacterium]|nr:lipocalin family protein [Bacteroidales bacterium]
MKKGIFFSLAVALMLSFGACTPDDNNNQNGNGNSENNNSLVGNWKVDNMTYNGQEMTPPDMVLVMNANGTGDVLMNGQSENNNFTWSVNGNVLTVHPNGGGEYSFTIVSISATEASLNGNVVPGTDMQGDVTMHLTKINGGGGDNPPDPPTGDFPAGTIWNYELNTSEYDPDEGVTYDITIQLRLHFNTGNQGVITMFEDVSVYGQSVYSDSEDQPFTYTYNSATNSGTITITDTDPDTGETETETTPFTYNAANNTIVLINPDPDPDDPLGNEIIFTRVNK